MTYSSATLSIQRSGSPATQGVLLVAHGERGGRLNNALLQSLADHVGQLLPDIEVRAGVLKGDPSIKVGWDALSAPNRFIYPFFMSDGFFVTRILPKKVREAIGPADRELSFLAPFGTSNLLTGNIERSIEAELLSLGRKGEKAPILLAAHGASVDRRSAIRTNELAQSLIDSRKFGPVRCAFLDEAPYLEDIVPDLDPDSLVLPLFNGLGSHSVDDIAELKHNSPDGVHYMQPVGSMDWVAKLICADISAALGLSVDSGAHLIAAQ